LRAPDNDHWYVELSQSKRFAVQLYSAIDVFLLEVMPITRAIANHASAPLRRDRRFFFESRRGRRTRPPGRARSVTAGTPIETRGRSVRGAEPCQTPRRKPVCRWPAQRATCIVVFVLLRLKDCSQLERARQMSAVVVEFRSPDGTPHGNGWINLDSPVIVAAHRGGAGAQRSFTRHKHSSPIMQPSHKSIALEMQTPSRRRWRSCCAGSRSSRPRAHDAPSTRS
jgi:hypothetical protein